MLAIVFCASALVAVTGAVYAGGLAAVLGHFSRPLQTQSPTAFRPASWVIVRATWFLRPITWPRSRPGIGILMCRLSAGFCFALLRRIFASRLPGKPG